VTDNRLRFDFSHFGQVTAEEIKRIEYLVNEKVWANVSVLIEEKGINEAKQMGATALFGEKYGERVRVVQIGDYSIELCGGCHVGSTSEVGVFKITGESGIGAGTRRIEAVTGQYAYEYFESRMQLLEETGSIVRSRAIDDIPQRAEALQEQIRSLQKENESLSQKLSNLEAGDLADAAEEINGIPVIAKELPGADKDTLRQTVDELKQKLGSGIVVLGTSEGEKVQLIAGVTKDLTERYKAGDIVKKAAEVCGGGGGGRPDMAQAGGKQPEKLTEALEEAKNFILTLS
jgi:alanyl-tRNA synthetase